METTNKIYLVQSEWATDTDYEITQKAFSTYEKAKTYFDILVGDAKEDDPLLVQEDCVVNESDDTFGIYIDGFYNENHLTVSIIPLTVDEVEVTK